MVVHQRTSLWRYIGLCVLLAAFSTCVTFIAFSRTQQSSARNVNMLIDFASYVIGLIGLPITRALFTPPLQFWNDQLPLENLLDTVDIYRDSHGVPYIFAKNELDLYFAQGFLHSTERPFQMEIMRLLSTGQLSSVLGEDLLDTDFISHMALGEEALLRKIASLSEENQIGLKAFADGISAGFQNMPATPVEFALLGHKPRTRWTLVDVAAVTTFMSLLLNRGLTGDIVKDILKRELKEHWNVFNFGYPRDVPVLNPEGPFSSLRNLQGQKVDFPHISSIDDSWASLRPFAPAQYPPSLKEKLGADAHVHTLQEGEVSEDRLKAFKQWLHTQEIELNEKEEKTPLLSIPARWDGSNAWVVSGKYTVSGKPLLAGDPHLEVVAPGLWVPMFLSSDGSTKRTSGVPFKKCKGIGGSFVGTPGIFVGHNEFAGWSQTVAHTDIEDLLLVNLDETGRFYFYDGKKIPLKISEHLITVKGRSSPVRHLVRATHHGPLLSDAVPKLRKYLKSDEALTWASTALRSPMSAEFAAAMLYGSTWEDYVRLTEHGPQNEFVTVWASVAGDIGATISGAVPIRRPVHDLKPFRNGSSSEDDWSGILTPENIPNVMNPPSGIIATSNCKLAEDKAGIYGEVFVPGQRVRRVMELLTELVGRKKVSVEDFADMQEDVLSLHGCEFKDFVLNNFLNIYEDSTPSTDQTRGARLAAAEENLSEADGRFLLTAFRAWDCRMNSASVCASLYEVWVQFVFQNLFEVRKYSEEALKAVSGFGFHPTWLPRTEALNHWRINVLNALKENSSFITEVISPSSLLARSAGHALSFLRTNYGAYTPDTLTHTHANDRATLWSWGTLRARFVEHIVGKAAPVFKHLLGLGPFNWGGNFGTVKAHHFEPHILTPTGKNTSKFSLGLDTTSFRVVLDLSDWEKCKWAFYPGVSGWVGSASYGNMINDLNEGNEKMHAMLWTRDQILGAAKTHKRLVPDNFTKPAPQNEEL